MAQTTSVREPRSNLVAVSHRVHDEQAEQAQTTAEYAVILTAITIGVVAAVALLGTNLGVHITDVANLVNLIR